MIEDVHVNEAWRRSWEILHKGAPVFSRQKFTSTMWVSKCSRTGVWRDQSQGSGGRWAVCSTTAKMYKRGKGVFNILEEVGQKGSPRS